MKLTVLAQASQDEAAAIGFGGATGALQVGHDIWVGSFTGEHLLRYTGMTWSTKRR